jgi:hypothetical protein
MITPNSGVPCWRVDYVNPEVDELHYPTQIKAEEDAFEAAVENPGAVRGVLQLAMVCYIAGCDWCGYREGEAEGAGHHIAAERPEHVVAQLGDLVATLDGRLACYECLPEAIEAQLEDWFLHDAPGTGSPRDMARALAPMLVAWVNE